MPEHDANGAARRPVLKLVTVDCSQDLDGTPSPLREAILTGKLWEFVGEFEAGGRETGAATAADAAHREAGPGVFQVFDAGSWGRGYWRG